MTMPTRTLAVAIGLALAAFSAFPCVARSADDDPATAEARKFLAGLKERGYHDLALDYLESLRKDPGTPADLKAELDYEEGKGLLEEASMMGDLERRQETLDRARLRLDAFTKSQPKNAKTPDALVQMSRILVERGHTDVLQANELKGAEAQAKLAQARASFAEARRAYDDAVKSLQGVLDTYPKFIPDTDKRFPVVRQLRNDRTMAKLQRSVVDYEDAQTYPTDPKTPQSEKDQRNALLDAARSAFEGIYRDYRQDMGGIYARMWQAKCMEEKGELGPAMGLYNELMDHSAAELKDLRRQVQFYQIIIDGKRGESALAVDRAAAWLNNFADARRSEEGLGVQLQLAKNILAQLPTISEANRDEAVRKATDRLGEVIRYASPYKPEAIELLRKYKPKASLNGPQIAKLNFADAMSQADQAIANQEWDRAIAFLKQAVRQCEPPRDLDNLNRARYFMAYAYYQSQRYYEAATVVDHLARNYPGGGLSAKSTDIGLAALTFAYNTFNKIDREADLKRLIDLADYTAKTWPDSEQADASRSTLGEIAMGNGRYLDASKSFEAIRPASSRRNEALVRAGDAHYREALDLRARGKAKEADEQMAAARKEVDEALQARRSSGVAPTDPGMITNVVALAEIDRDAGRAKEAVALLTPTAKALETASGPEVASQRSKVITTLLRAHIGAGESNLAIADMKALETVSTDPQALTQLFFELGRSLKKEMDTLEARGKAAELQKTTQAFKEFLQALTASTSGQSFASLQWAGEQLLTMGKSEEALGVFDRVLKLSKEKPDFFGPAADAPAKLQRVEIKHAVALRAAGRYAESMAESEAIVKANPRSLEALLEQGETYEAGARAGTYKWNQSLVFWTNLAAKLERSRPRPAAYYECWLHVAEARNGLGEKAKAVQTLKGVMTLSPGLGSPEMKARYADMIRRLGS